MKTFVLCCAICISLIGAYFINTGDWPEDMCDWIMVTFAIIFAALLVSGATWMILGLGTKTVDYDEMASSVELLEIQDGKYLRNSPYDSYYEYAYERENRGKDIARATKNLCYFHDGEPRLEIWHTYGARVKSLKGWLPFAKDTIIKSTWYVVYLPGGEP